MLHYAKGIKSIAPLPRFLSCAKQLCPELLISGTLTGGSTGSALQGVLTGKTTDEVKIDCDAGYGLVSDTM